MKLTSRLLCLAALFFLFRVEAPAQVSIPVWQNDLMHSGLNSNETTLTPGLISAPGDFGLLYTQPTDGQSYGQPLIAAGVMINGVAHNIVYVATEHDSIYAYDADSNTGSNSTYLWHDSFITSNVTVPPPQSIVGSGDISVELGITTTPVIDTSTIASTGSGTIYIVSKLKIFLTEHSINISTRSISPPVRKNSMDRWKSIRRFRQRDTWLRTSQRRNRPGKPGLVDLRQNTRTRRHCRYIHRRRIAGVVPFSPLHEHSAAPWCLQWHRLSDLRLAQRYHALSRRNLGYNATTLAFAPPTRSSPRPMATMVRADSGPAAPARPSIPHGQHVIMVANGSFDQNSSPYNNPLTGRQDYNWGESVLKLPTGGRIRCELLHHQYNNAGSDQFFTPTIF